MPNQDLPKEKEKQELEKQEPEKQEKSRLHPRNKNRDRYDLDALIACKPALSKYVKPNKYGVNSVDFSNPTAVKLLNKAILHHYYGIENWEFPEANLCPPIPGRADYIHFAADLLIENNFGRLPKPDKIRCLDIGVGASCIYPIIGVTEYNWNFVGSDTSQAAIDSANQIISANPSLEGKIECRLQEHSNSIFNGIIQRNEKFDLTVCNPPFHASAEAAEKGTQRKLKNLSGKKSKSKGLNFSGIHSELIYEGGEMAFIQNMITESKTYGKRCLWFSTLVSKQSTVKSIYRALEKIKGAQIKTIPMGTGNKSTRIVAWTFLTKPEQAAWAKARW